MKTKFFKITYRSYLGIIKSTLIEIPEHLSREESILLSRMKFMEMYDYQILDISEADSDGIRIANLMMKEVDKQLQIKPFSYEWWIEVGKRAYSKAENSTWDNYYYEVALYCKFRAYENK